MPLRYVQPPCPRRSAGPVPGCSSEAAATERVIDRQTIADRIKEFLETEFAGQGIELTETTNLLEDYFVDSFGIIDTVMFLEKTFGIELARVDINGENFRDIASLSNFVARRLSP